MLTSHHSGFRKSDSPAFQLTDLVNTFLKDIDDGRGMSCIFDIRKAFARMWHRRLLFKLFQCGITGNLLGWFEIYLQGRPQKVIIEGASSTTKLISLLTTILL